MFVSGDFSEKEWLEDRKIEERWQGEKSERTEGYYASFPGMRGRAPTKHRGTLIDDDYRNNTSFLV